MLVNEEACERFGLDSKAVASIARRMSRAAREASELGLIVFGGAGSGSLRFAQNDRGGHQMEVASLDGNFDGGDGGDDY